MSKASACDALVAGAGPAGLTAAIQLARLGFRVAVADPDPPGGRARLLPRIENYPGFPGGVAGRALMRRFAAQARAHGALLLRRKVLGVRRRRGGFLVRMSSGPPLRARSVLPCTGAVFKSLGVPGERRLAGRGVHHAAFGLRRGLSGRRAVVAGGGEAAAHQTLYLAKAARRVFLVCRSGSLRAHPLLRRRLAERPNIEVLRRRRVAGLLGRRRLEGIELVGPRGGRSLLKAEAIFVLVGARGAAAALTGGRRQAGVFPAGDALGGRCRQVAAAAGDGLRAAMECTDYLEGGRRS